MWPLSKKQRQSRAQTIRGPHVAPFCCLAGGVSANIVVRGILNVISWLVHVTNGKLWPEVVVWWLALCLNSLSVISRWNTGHPDWRFSWFPVHRVKRLDKVKCKVGLAAWRGMDNFMLRPIYLRERALGSHRTRVWVGPGSGLEIVTEEKTLLPAGNRTQVVHLIDKTGLS
jgi:hypothetical protein